MYPPTARSSRCRPLRWLALVMALVPALWWWHAGARLGFWQTQVAVTITDAVTGLTVQEWRPQFVPGIETPALGLALAAAALGVSLFLNRRNPNQKSTP